MRQSYFLALICLLFCAASARAQSVDLGAQFSIIRFSGLAATDAGFGGRATLNFTNSIGIDAEINFFPIDKRGPFQGGRKIIGLLGLKTASARVSSGCSSK